MKRKPYLAFTAATVLVAAVSFAHNTSGIIEIEAIDSRIDAQLDATSGKLHKAYAALAHVIRTRSRPARGLGDDMTKLIATVKACRSGPLATDDVLKGALPAPEAQADAYLANQPGNVRVAEGLLERAGDRAAVEKLVVASETAHEAGLARRDANDELGMLAQFRTAGLDLARAGLLAQSLLAKQVKRGAPGQPLKKGPKGTIDTYAGTGVSAFAGDGGPALDAAFYFPMDVAVEPATGLVYVCDFNNHRIRRIDADGKVRTVVGNGQAAPVEDGEGPAREVPLHHPGSIAFDPVSGDLFVAGWHVPRIVRWNQSSDLVAHFAGTGVRGNDGDEGPAADATFDYPSCTAFAASGAFFVADQDNARIRRVDAQGVVHAFAGTGAAGFSGDDGQAKDAQFQSPLGEVDAPAGRCCLDPKEQFLYVADTSNHRVRRVELSSGIITTICGTGAVGSDGDGGAATDATLDTPVDVDCDADGNVYVCDRERHVVRKIDVTTKTVSTYAGIAGLASTTVNGKPATLGNGNAATNARLNHPQGIFLDRTRGRLYVADTFDGMIRVVWE